jgi:AraC family transcriptional regulator of adaptative response / methylphosphotriester-DNA alkyltransferase methyltransferase
MDEALWRAIVNCETTFDGKYYYGVITTGIFCRPSCRSRTPNIRNVRIFRSFDEAIASGFRPCKRCRPDKRLHGPDAEIVENVKKIIENRYYEKLTLAQLSSEVAISPYHLHRIFKRFTGMTPAEYVLQVRIEAAKQALNKQRYSTITEIALALGFNSISHFSSVFKKLTGQTPSDYRQSQLNYDKGGELLDLQTRVRLLEHV